MRVRGRLRLRRLSQAPMTGYVPHRLVGHRHCHRPAFRIPVKKKTCVQTETCVCMYVHGCVRPSIQPCARPPDRPNRPSPGLSNSCAPCVSKHGLPHAHKPGGGARLPITHSAGIDLSSCPYWHHANDVAATAADTTANTAAGSATDTDNAVSAMQHPTNPTAQATPSGL